MFGTTTFEVVDTMPVEIRIVAAELKAWLESDEAERLCDFEFDRSEWLNSRIYICQHVKGEYSSENAWCVSDNYESGISPCIFRDGKWFYRTFRTGEDVPLMGGTNEVVSHFKCMVTH